MQDNTIKFKLFKFTISTCISITALVLGYLISKHLSNTEQLQTKLKVNLPENKILLINFWATWCPPCREEIPDFIRLHDEFKDRDFSVIGLAIDKQDKVNAFEQEIGISYPSLIVEKEGYALMEEYGSLHGALPYTVILDKKGNIAYKHHKGIFSYQEAKELIEPLL